MEHACTYCLSEQGHVGGVFLEVTGDTPRRYVLQIPPLTEQISAEFAADERATELGACGIAVLLARRMLNFPNIERARRGGGFDYWLGNEPDVYPFQHNARLEVSGIRSGGELEIKRRVRQKERQTAASDHTRLPAYAAIVEFSAPLAHVSRR
jgi:hypothetical protein